MGWQEAAVINTGCISSIHMYTLSTTSSDFTYKMKFNDKIIKNFKMATTETYAKHRALVVLSSVYRSHTHGAGSECYGVTIVKVICCQNIIHRIATLIYSYLADLFTSPVLILFLCYGTKSTH